MKKTMLILIGCLLTASNSFAENRLGVMSGMNYTYSKSKDNGFQQYYGYPGFNAGLSYERSFAGSAKGNPFFGVSFQFSNENVQRVVEWEGYRYEDPVIDELYGYEEGTYKIVVHSYVLKLPISLGYNFKLSDKVGLAPKGGVSFSKYLKDDAGFYGYRSFLGANVNVGKHFQVAVSHEWELSVFQSGAKYVSPYRHLSVNLTYFPFNF